MLTQNIKFKEELEYSILYSSSKDHKTGYFNFSDILTGRSIILHCIVLKKKDDDLLSCTLPIHYQAFFGCQDSKTIYLKITSVTPQTGILPSFYKISRGRCVQVISERSLQREKS